MNAPQPQRTAPMRSKFHSPKPAAEPDEQRLFLEQCRKSAALVSVALTTGPALVGVIVAVEVRHRRSRTSQRASNVALQKRHRLRIAESGGASSWSKRVIKVEADRLMGRYLAEKNKGA